MNIINYRETELRSEQAKKNFQYTKKQEWELYGKIYKKFHDQETFKIVVTREYCYQQWPEAPAGANTYSDVSISYQKEKRVEFFDFFCPQDKFSFAGCIRTKKMKLRNFPVSIHPTLTHKIYYVCVNKKFTQKEIDSWKTDRGGVEILAYDTFITRWL